MGAKSTEYAQNLSSLHSPKNAIRMLTLVQSWRRIWYCGPGKCSAQYTTSLQRRAAQVIARAFRSTSGPALDVELHLLPVKHMLEKALGETLSRLRTSRVYYQIVEARRESRATEDNFRYWSPLRKLEERYDAHGWLDRETLKSMVFGCPSCSFRLSEVY